jgi:DNA-binding beta-propeller fold protein YncE
MANSSDVTNVARHSTLRGSATSPNASIVPHRATGTHSIEVNCCANKKTLFISDSGNNTVQVFDFPSNSYIGELSSPPEGFNEPQGMCSDNKGDVYVANTANE